MGRQNVMGRRVLILLRMGKVYGGKTGCKVFVVVVVVVVVVGW